MAEFVLKNNFDFNGQIKQKILGTAIGTKCATTYACIYRVRRWKENFWRKKNINVSHGFDISIVFSLFGLKTLKLKTFSENLNHFHPNIRFIHESRQRNPFFQFKW